MSTISRQAYIEMYGPTTGDNVRLGDSEFWNKVEGFYELENMRQRSDWERTRWSTCLLLNIQLPKNKSIKYLLISSQLIKIFELKQVLKLEI